MTRAQALQRLVQCRENQPEAMQVVVAADIVDAILSTEGDHAKGYEKALERVADGHPSGGRWTAYKAQEIARDALGRMA